MYGLKIISSNSNYFYHRTVSIHNLYFNIWAELEYQQATAVPLQTDKPKGYSGAPTWKSLDTHGDREMVKMQHHYKELNISSGPYNDIHINPICCLYAIYILKTIQIQKLN